MSLDKVPQAGELYIGGMISMRRYEALKKANITHVVSALRQPLDEDLFKDYKHLVIEVDDFDDEDILQHFATSNAFIQEGLDGGGGVLVHCAMGKSRSAALVIAYLISRDPRIIPERALESIRTVRSFVEPNEGFMEQLRLYHRMTAPKDIDTEPMYQRWLFERSVKQSVDCGQAPENIRFEDEQNSVEGVTSGLEIRCRKCRRTLATSNYVVIHEPKPPSATQDALIAAANAPASMEKPRADGNTTFGVASQCAHLFVDPLSWMRPELEKGKLDGRLECPKCNANVGKYAWQGMKCSCGAWVVPGISLSRNRVDEIRARPLVSPGGERGGVVHRGFGGKM